MACEPASSSSALVVASTCSTLVLVSPPAAEVPSPLAKAKAVPFSCFKVVCNFVLSLGGTLEVFRSFRFQTFQIVILRFACVWCGCLKTFKNFRIAV